ncbi:MAG: Fis family transcriptional regulator, partial [Clostridiaceae bacterium]|nr:Fis family transcriptional regulator [Clostridiaceae bacterium]
IKIPPLRERKEDLQQLIEYFIKTESGKTIYIEVDALEKLLQYDWYGNVRELKNILSYMLAVRDSDCLTVKDIPDKGFFLSTTVPIEEKIHKHTMVLQEDVVYLLEKIYRFNEKDKLVGREKLAKVTEDSPYPMTTAQIRTKLDKLEAMNFINKKRGKHGTVVTEKGKKYLMDLFGDLMEI